MGPALSASIERGGMNQGAWCHGLRPAIIHRQREREVLVHACPLGYVLKAPHGPEIREMKADSLLLCSRQIKRRAWYVMVYVPFVFPRPLIRPIHASRELRFNVRPKLQG